MKFICDNVYLVPQNRSIVTADLSAERPLKIPIAHGEGRYYANDETLKKLNDKEQVLFRYCDADGKINAASNPNGSLENIAGICNEGRNVFGMMPHPERAADPVLFNTDGSSVLRSIINNVMQFV